MNTRKNNNSVLFLATLGVYLGLVLAGATPQVLANAAMTRSFDVKDEIEFNDNLDKKPDDCGQLADKVKEKLQGYYFDDKAVEKYISGLPGVFSTYSHLFPGLTFEWVAYGGESASGGQRSNGNKPILIDAKAAQNLDEAVWLTVDSFPRLNSQEKPAYRFRIESDRSFTTATSSFWFQTETDAHKAFIAHDASLDLSKCNLSDPQKTIARNTTLTWSGSNILVVTRLPRAGLDSLLASDAK